MDVEEEKRRDDSAEEEEDVDENEAPSPVKCRSTVLDLDYHPTERLICCGLVSSELEIWIQKNDDGPSAQFSRVARITGLHRQEACRTIAFNPQGTILFTGGADGGLHGIDCSQGQTIWTCFQGNDKIPVNRISTCLANELGPTVLLSGDENGTIKLWDIREKPDAPKFNFPASHQDFVSDFCYAQEEKRLLTTGGDGTLSVFDLRKLAKVRGEARSEELETELLSIALLKNGKKVLCGTQEGLISIFNWGKWEFPSDTITGHPHSVDCLLKLDEDTILTGSSDGIIRIVRVHPHKLLGVIGYHDDFPVERMKFSPDKRLVATCSHDNLVRFWDTGFLVDSLDDLKEMGDLGGMSSGGNNQTARGSDVEMGSDDDDDEDGGDGNDANMGGDSDSEDEAKKKRKKAKPKKLATVIRQATQQAKKKAKSGGSGSFFDDL